ncbi:hypothetical protein NDU88_003092 [Pleurodeles waltl]|uniref:Uncharacterized protein n=1 Tax=Pleurodeles waltl TaxID=8319 RepID=A0AAV7WUC3_PLEWA|nr:hypothetical protein NDU88_003092 [Pleurodeles waltl]
MEKYVEQLCSASPVPLRLLTWIVRGLNDNRKIRKVVPYLRTTYRHTIDVAVLKEMHLAPSDKEEMQQRMQGSVCVAGFTSHARGVLIWVRKGEGISLQEMCADPAGRYVVAKYTIGKCMLLVVGVYGPNYDDPKFYNDLSTRLQ